MPSTTAFVLGGGGVLGAVEVGMLKALFEHDVHPDLVVGTSVGAINGSLVALEPGPAVVDRLVDLWRSAGTQDVYAGNAFAQLRTVARSGTHLYSSQPLRERLAAELGSVSFDDLPVRFQCCASNIEGAREHWFDSGRVVDAVVASAAVPGLLPPAELDGEHFLDGGIVNSIPIGRAHELGADRIFVLQVGRVDRPLAVPTKPWQVARVSFEIARRHRFHRELAALPESVQAHVLPTGGGSDKDDSFTAYRDFSKVQERIDAAYEATARYLGEHL